MRVRVVCSNCNFSFNLPTTNLRFVEACPGCFGPRSALLVAERSPDSASNTPVPDTRKTDDARPQAVDVRPSLNTPAPVSSAKPTTKIVKLPQPRPRKTDQQ